MACSKKTMKSINMRALLSSILRDGPTSQKQLLETASLDKCTISVLINELKSQGFIISAGDGEASSLGGRKPQFLDLDREKIVGLGIALRKKSLSFGLHDLNGKLLWESTVNIEKNQSSIWAPIIIDVVKKTEKECDEKGRIFIGAGFSIGCLYDPMSNKLINISNSEEKDLSIDKIISCHLNSIPFVADDFPNAMAIGEMWFGDAKTLDNFLYVQMFPTRITFVTDKKIYRGHRGFAGEIGSSSFGKKFNALLEEKAEIYSTKFFKEWISDLTLYFDPQRIIISTESGSYPSEEELKEISTEIVGVGKLGLKDRTKGAVALTFKDFFYPDLINAKKERVCR